MLQWGLHRLWSSNTGQNVIQNTCSEAMLMLVQDAPAITKAALDGSNPLAVEAVDLFLAIIGAEAGYLGLRALATGGVYLCGGITPRVSARRISSCRSKWPALLCSGANRGWVRVQVAGLTHGALM